MRKVFFPFVPMQWGDRTQSSRHGRGGVYFTLIPYIYLITYTRPLHTLHLLVSLDFYNLHILHLYTYITTLPQCPLYVSYSLQTCVYITALRCTLSTHISNYTLEKNKQVFFVYKPFFLYLQRLGKLKH